jgi:tetratricopeptide (TPR) repeat protein
MHAALFVALLTPLAPPEGTPPPAAEQATIDPLEAAWVARKPGLKEAEKLFRMMKAAADKTPTAERVNALAEAAYWRGLQQEDANLAKATRKASFTTCRDASDRVQKLSPKAADGYFWSAVCRAKIAELTGIVSSAWELPELIDLMKKVDELHPGYGNGGTDRYWGAVIVRTPGFLRAMQGKDLDDAETFFKNALKRSPDYAGTWMHLAELELKRDDEKAAAMAYDRAIKSPRARDPGVEAWNRYYRMKATQAKRALER